MDAFEALMESRIARQKSEETRILREIKAREESKKYLPYLRKLCVKQLQKAVAEGYTGTMVIIPNLRWAWYFKCDSFVEACRIVQEELRHMGYYVSGRYGRRFDVDWKCPQGPEDAPLNVVEFVNGEQP